MDKEYSIEVWDLKFYKVDDEGNALLNDDGTVKLFDSDIIDCAYLASGIEDYDLEECE